MISTTTATTATLTTVGGSITTDQYNAHVAARATSAVAEAGYTVADVAQWIGKPVADVAAMLRGEDDLDVGELMTIASRCGTRASIWLKEIGL